MNKTQVDDMLIEMISPRIREIEEKFSRGEGLDQEDINTLLLKSQYNHINHLDTKLTEITADVANLKNEFMLLKNDLEGNFDLLKNDLEGKFDLLKNDLESKFDLLRTEVNARFDTFEKNIELKISEAINTNMRWSIGMIALIVTVLKLADMFLG